MSDGEQSRSVCVLSSRFAATCLTGAGQTMQMDATLGNVRAIERTSVRRSRFTEEQIIGILQEQEAGMRTAEVCDKHGISHATYYGWKARYSGLSVSNAKKLKQLEAENGNLRRLLAEALLDNAVLKSVGLRKG